MAFKFIAFAAFVAVARAGVIAPGLHYAAAPALAHHGLARPLAYAAPVAKIAAPLAYAAPVAKAVVNAEYDPNPQYHYAYSVADALTGDNKQQQESRSGDVVQGSYSLVESDGTRRTVEYTADPVNGFNAVVHKEPLVQKAVVAAPVVAKVAAPVYHAAPIAKIATPVHYAPAVAKYAAPVAHYGAPLAHYGAPAYAASTYHGNHYAAPVVAKVAAPLAHYATPIHG